MILYCILSNLFVCALIIPGRMMTISLYSYRICPFCNAVKAVMRWYRVPYNVIEVNPLTKSELNWSKEYRKVPIAVIESSDGKRILNESENIIQHITANAANKSSFSSPDALRWAVGCLII